MDKKKYYITTAIAYTSGKPHIGNTYEAVLADSIARFKRQQGYDVFFQTGTDEHGQKIELKAAEAGVTCKEFVDNVAGEIKSIWDLMNTSYDKFIRTTDEDHEKQVQKIFKKLYDQGDIYKGYYEGMYCTPCESFFTESQLVDGKCPDCGRPVTPAKEEAYFFRMSKYAQRLIDHINTHPEFIQPVSRKNEMMNNFLLPGLQDLCVSRTSFKWGIPVDFDPKHVVYVWLDALTNYITGIGYDCDGESTEQFKKDWIDTFGLDEEANIEEIYENIKLPRRATAGSAGYDFFAPVRLILAPGETIKIPTGIRVEMEPEWVLKCYPRSGLGFKYRLQLNNTVGIIDSDYFYSDNEGHMFSKITNDTNEEKTIDIAQGEGFMQGIFVEYGITLDDDVTDVRNGGFGSTTK